MHRLAQTHSHLRPDHHRTMVAAAAAAVSNNPLLLHKEMPRFNEITAEHVGPAITQLLEKQDAAVKALEASVTQIGVDVTYADVLVPLEQLLAPLGYAFGLVGHLLAVRNSPELRDAHAAA
jgi:oligopeptidase A